MQYHGIEPSQLHLLQQHSAGRMDVLPRLCADPLITRILARVLSAAARSVIIFAAQYDRHVPKHSAPGELPFSEIWCDPVTPSTLGSSVLE